MRENTAERLAAQIAKRQGGLITRTQATEVGLSAQQIRYRLQKHRWGTAGHDAFLVDGQQPLTWHLDLLAACLVLNGVASHRSALRLWELRPTELVEVTVARADYRRRAGVTVVSTAQPDLLGRRTISRVPVTSIERTLIDMASVAQLDEVLEVAAAAITAGLTNQHKLTLALSAHSRKGRPGLRRARQAIQQLAEDQALTQATSKVA